jgi:hypothetical protein
MVICRKTRVFPGTALHPYSSIIRVCKFINYKFINRLAGRGNKQLGNVRDAQGNLGRGVLEVAQKGGWLPEARFGGAQKNHKPHQSQLPQYRSPCATSKTPSPKIPLSDPTIP